MFAILSLVMLVSALLAYHHPAPFMFFGGLGALFLALCAWIAFGSSTTEARHLTD
jgi:hypothetical protein